ncbi:HAL protein kinase [Gaeumannomyces tritici R3-111a-1]|uniref:non-specific serine/threonine protein kinase n=1 Tax=Gaeumannomyces tritici (strain R3-111a-1) TaxID=644352 RepID=J3NS90_GAET3|nr:HAL protein kinase [Gaeumannomyces tritici R3-111a-1]EJT79046.1 HAL protein kinase [Gaeumannomyces tritici R3-111a-1]
MASLPGANPSGPSAGAGSEPSDAQLSPESQAPPEETPAQAVRFRSVVEEIGPQLPAAENPAGATAFSAEPVASAAKALGDPAEVTPTQLSALAQSLQGSHLHDRRMNIFSFQPVSLPASRTVSHDDESRIASRQNTRSTAGPPQSPLPSPRAPEMQSPPLTPAATGQTDAEARRQKEPKSSSRHDLITPQDSTQESSPPASAHPSLRPEPQSSTEDIPRRPRSSQEKEAPSRVGGHRKGMFSAGPGSLPASRESSPSRLAASQLYSRPFTPDGDANDPYAAHRRPQQKNIEPRFQFSLSKKKLGSTASSSASLRGSPDKRSSGFFGSKNTDLHREPSSAPTINSRPGSMADLKRFFKVGQNKVQRSTSPSPSVKSTNRVASASRSPAQVPFGSDHGLSSKYGKLGKVLGSGAGGSVRLMRRGEDNTVFAVKEFRPRHTYETEKEYVKKLTAEYCIGSSLHHGNIIETLDIVQEKGKWYEVMEYAPYDLFAIVMTGKMSREEVTCSFLQILSGVTYLHSMGLSHRDLKLDNVVVSEHGIMKIIDFGSAHVFKYPFENGINLAKGIVGSDPYLAPEVYDERRYDPAAVDIWSLAIIYCCMTLRRFPWKLPRMTDNSFKLFATDPTPGHDPKKLVLPAAKSTTDLSDTPHRDIFVQGENNKTAVDRAANQPSPAQQQPQQGQGDGAAPERREIIRGPWRILRLLPRESRHVVSRMLALDPKERAKMSEIIEDPWVANTIICRQDGPGQVVSAEDHTHVLEPPSIPSTAPK